MCILGALLRITSAVEKVSFREAADPYRRANLPLSRMLTTTNAQFQGFSTAKTGVGSLRKGNPASHTIKSDVTRNAARLCIWVASSNCRRGHHIREAALSISLGVARALLGLAPSEECDRSTP